MDLSPKAADHLPKEMLANLHKYFDEIDLDKNGLIDIKEFQIALKRVGFNFDEKVITKMFKLVRYKQDQIGLNFHQFVEVSGFIDNMKSLFIKFDTDKNGKIDFPELGTALLDIGFNLKTETIKKLLKKVDGDHSGTIEFEEFVDMSFYLRFLRKNQKKVNKSETDEQEIAALLQSVGMGHITPGTLQDEAFIN